MLFAKHWASTRVEVPEDFGWNGPVSVWGASNESEDGARAAAADRAARLRAFFEGRGGRDDYTYFAGFVREEVVREVADGSGAPLAVVTRNHYGALVLNTERVLFGDIDVPPEGALARLLNRLGRRPRDKAWHLERIRMFQQANKSYVFVVWETAAGLRFAVTNRELRPDDATLGRLFAPLKVDRLYTRLCKAQTCFRARLTAKPWRVGVERPPCRFPRRDEAQAAAHAAWLAGYERASSGTCAARRLAVVGHAPRLPDAVTRVLELHDALACDEHARLA